MAMPQKKGSLAEVFNTFFTSWKHLSSGT